MVTIVYVRTCVSVWVHVHLFLLSFFSCYLIQLVCYFMIYSKAKCTYWQMRIHSFFCIFFATDNNFCCLWIAFGIRQQSCNFRAKKLWMFDQPTFIVLMSIEQQQTFRAEKRWMPTSLTMNKNYLFKHLPVKFEKKKWWQWKDLIV